VRMVFSFLSAINEALNSLRNFQRENSALGSLSSGVQGSSPARR
jgi:hypothetical protein